MSAPAGGGRVPERPGPGTAVLWVPFHGPDDYARHGSRVAERLAAGGLIAFATETVYGFGCALVPAALRRLAQLKAREGRRPFLLLVAHPDQAPGLAWTPTARRLAEAFWPGPLTLALRAEPGRYPPEVTDPRGTVAVRISPHPAVAAILEAFGAPVTSTSANVPGEPPAATPDEVEAAIHRLGAADAFWLLDSGPLPPSAPSTVVDCAADPPGVLRPGAIPVTELRAVVPDIEEAGRE